MLTGHRALGPGLLESTYQACLAYELRCRGIEVDCEVALPVRYGAIDIEVGYRIDMLVAKCIIIENKSVQAVLPINDPRFGFGGEFEDLGVESQGLGRGLRGS